MMSDPPLAIKRCVSNERFSSTHVQIASGGIFLGSPGCIVDSLPCHEFVHPGGVSEFCGVYIHWDVCYRRIAISTNSCQPIVRSLLMEASYNRRTSKLTVDVGRRSRLHARVAACSKSHNQHQLRAAPVGDSHARHRG